MTKAFRHGAAALALIMFAAIAPATAQSPAISDQQDAPPAGSPKGPKASPAAAPVIAGNWIGQLTALGGSTAVNFELAVTASGGETKYPDLDCTGKLRRIGSSRSYVFFVEIITKGRADKGGRCRDGSVTISRQGDSLPLVWYGSFPDSVILAFGTLSKK